MPHIIFIQPLIFCFKEHKNKNLYYKKIPRNNTLRLPLQAVKKLIYQKFIILAIPCSVEPSKKMTAILYLWQKIY